MVFREFRDRNLVSDGLLIKKRKVQIPPTVAFATVGRI